MGEKVWDWVLPIHRSQGDGIHFEHNKTLLAKLQARAKEVIRTQMVSNSGRESRVTAVTEGSKHVNTGSDV